MSSLVRNLLFLFGLICVVVMVVHFDTNGEGAAQFIDSAWPWLPIVLGVWIFVYAFNALAYKTLVNLTATSQAARLNYPEAVQLTISGFAFSYITPMGFGGLPYRIMELRDRFGTARATASTLLYSMTHVLSHFLLWTTAVILFPFFFAEQLSTPLIVMLILFLVVALLVFVIFLRGVRKGIASKLLALCATLPLIQRYVISRLSRYSEAAKQIDEGLSMLHRAPKRFLLALSCEYVARLVNTWEFVFILMAFGHSISYIDALMILAFSSLVGNIFFFLPLQLGAREGGVATIVSLLSLPTVVGIYTAFYTRVREIFWVAIGVVLIKFYSRKRS